MSAADNRPLSHDELKQLRAAMQRLRLQRGDKERCYLLLIDVLMVTGIRPEELRRVRVGDVKHADLELLVTSPAKGSKTRRAPLTRALAKGIADAAKSAELKDENLLWDIVGRDISREAKKRRLERAFERLRLEAFGVGCRLGVYSLRHSFVQDIYDATGDIVATAEAVGHVNINSTLSYAKRSKLKETNQIARNRFKRAKGQAA